tara:strand:- start:1139 stop:1609 length:471 start_codon:yes stop_codon:yes gene_type:complete
MKLTYGLGEVIADTNIKAFDITYDGAVEIYNVADNLMLFANQNRIIGIMVDGNFVSGNLFSYEGEFKIIKCDGCDDSSLYPMTVVEAGLDIWDKIDEQWVRMQNVNWDELSNEYRVGKKPLKTIIRNDKYADLKKQKRINSVNILNVLNKARKGTY